MKLIRGMFWLDHANGSILGGNIGEHLDTEHVRPFVSYFRIADGVRRLELLLDYYGVRYHLLLKYNTKITSSEENKLLDALSQSCNGGNYNEEISLAARAKCLDLFWPVVAVDFVTQEARSTKKESFKEYYQIKETVKIQLCTKEDGTLRQQPHDELRLYPFSDPIKNPCPSDVPIFQREEIEYLEDLKRGHVLKAKMGDEEVLVKGVDRVCMLRELEILMRLRTHPNLVPPLMGVVDAGHGCIDQFILPFIKGKRLSHISAASADQKAAWKSQISKALSVVHAAGIAWGDVASYNVMIEDESDKAIVLDFGEGYYKGCESSDESRKWQSYDLSDLAKLNEEIDGLDPL